MADSKRGLQAARDESLSSDIKAAVEKKGIALMTHIVCGYPSLEANWEILEIMEEAGVDVVEMQFPFSEPIADGPLFLQANQESLSKGTHVSDCFHLMAKASQKFSFKLLMMGYYNTVFTYGEKAFCRKLEECGARGLIVPDLPVEEAGNLIQCCREHGQNLIRLVSPANTEERLKTLLKDAEGFVYAVARSGVTGSHTKFSKETENYLARLKEWSPVPLAVGFGVTVPEDIQFLTGRADMAVIGTAVLKSYLAGGREAVREFFKGLQTAAV